MLPDMTQVLPGLDAWRQRLRLPVLRFVLPILWIVLSGYELVRADTVPICAMPGCRPELGTFKPIVQGVLVGAAAAVVPALVIAPRITIWISIVIAALMAQPSLDLVSATSAWAVLTGLLLVIAALEVGARARQRVISSGWRFRRPMVVLPAGEPIAPDRDTRWLGLSAMTVAIALSALVAGSYVSASREIAAFEARSVRTTGRVIAADPDVGHVIEVDGRVVNIGSPIIARQLGTTVAVLVDPLDPDRVVLADELEDPSWIPVMIGPVLVVGAALGVHWLRRGHRLRQLLTASQAAVTLRVGDTGERLLLTTLDDQFFRHPLLVVHSFQRLDREHGAPIHDWVGTRYEPSPGDLAAWVSADDDDLWDVHDVSMVQVLGRIADSEPLVLLLHGTRYLTSMTVDPLGHGPRLREVTRMTSAVGQSPVADYVGGKLPRRALHRTWLLERGLPAPDAPSRAYDRHAAWLDDLVRRLNRPYRWFDRASTGLVVEVGVGLAALGAVLLLLLHARLPERVDVLLYVAALLVPASGLMIMLGGGARSILRRHRYGLLHGRLLWQRVIPSIRIELFEATDHAYRLHLAEPEATIVVHREGLRIPHDQRRRRLPGTLARAADDVLVEEWIREARQQRPNALARLGRPTPQVYPVLLLWLATVLFALITR